jgi:hypothetical protein
MNAGPIGYDPISLSDRTDPLTETELRASLLAMQRLLVAVRMMAWEQAGHEQIAEFIDLMHNMPEMLLKPGFYADLFRPSLERLAELNPCCRGILAEYDDALKTGERPTP